MTSDELLSIYRRSGCAAYHGEAVSQTQHALQAAFFARTSGATDALVVAALLHDIGHLIVTVPEDIAHWESDGGHEVVGSQWLAQRFGPAVCEPVRLHVPAKRYLYATNPDYRKTLSAASLVTLALQGGPMSPVQVNAFEAQPYHRDAVVLRQWDDRGKIAGLRTPELSEYVDLIERLANEKENC